MEVQPFLPDVTLSVRIDSDSDEVRPRRSLTDYLQETKFGGIKTFTRFMIVDPGAVWKVVFFVHRLLLAVLRQTPSIRAILIL